MPQWEYTCILGGSDTVFDDAGKESPIQTYLAQMGRSGWELVAVTPQGGSGQADPCFFYWFKRQMIAEKPEPPLRPPPDEKAPPTQLDDEEADLMGGFGFGGFPGVR
jgi:hypothetical protein